MSAAAATFALFVSTDASGLLFTTQPHARQPIEQRCAAERTPRRSAQGVARLERERRWGAIKTGPRAGAAAKSIGRKYSGQR